MYLLFGKRLFDTLLAAAGLIILLPLFVSIVLLILLRHGDNPFFVQTRTGWKERPFRIYKFKTIRYEWDGDQNSPQPTISRLGLFLRKYSFDELPQLWNVVRGDMSLIGPRPLLPEYLPLYNPPDRIRHSVRPGMTGLAQVRGRNRISWSHKFRYDKWYCGKQSFEMDLFILFQTVSVVFLALRVEENPSQIVMRFDNVHTLQAS